MKERPILFSGPMVRAILEGRKTQTRRKVDALAAYRLTDDRILAIHSPDENEYRRCAEADPVLSKFRLRSGGRWTDLLQNQICRIWAEGTRGLVCVERSQNQKRLSVNFTVSREQESNQVGSPACLLGVSRGAEESINASQAPRRKSFQQPSGKPLLGNPRGELGRQGFAWKREFRGEPSIVEAFRRGEIIGALGNLKGDVQPKESCQMPWDVPSVNLADCKWGSVGQRLWVRETWCEASPEHRDTPGARQAFYRADSPSVEGDEARLQYIRLGHDYRWRPSIHMPRWASRLTLEITAVRVERLQDITDEDCWLEGIDRSTESPTQASTQFSDYAHPRRAFSLLWESINGPGSWDANPWVWVVEFRKVEDNR